MLFLPKTLPAAAQLKAQGIDTSALPLRAAGPEAAISILLLNLMPEKEVTEFDIARTLAQTELDIHLIPIKIKGQTYKTTPMAHMEACYRDFNEIEHGCYDGIIITGAPVEQIPFEDVHYWPQLCHIMDWAQTHTRSALHVCWGAQAGLYHHYGVPKHALPEKKFGIFNQSVLCPESPLMTGLAPSFPMPNSRHTEVRRVDLEPLANRGVNILAESVESGIAVVADRNLHNVFIVGHLEYAADTLHREYHRDLSRHLPIHAPEHYYNPDGQPDFKWREAAITFYRNWCRVARQNF